MKNEDIIKMNQGKKFDVILSNPPYNLANKMLAKYFEIGSEICTVQPSTWLLGKQQKKDIVKHVDTWDYSDIESINGNEFFDANIGGVMAIQLFKENNPINHNRRYIMFDGKKYDKCEEISAYSNDELLMEFKSIIEPLYLKDNLQNYIFGVPGNIDIPKKINKHQNINNIVLRLTALIGGEQSFYSLMYKGDLNKNIGKYCDLIYEKDKTNKQYLQYYIDINTTNKNNIINLQHYLMTYFVRICLYFNKTNLHLFRGELKTIPMFDFSDSIFNNQPEDIDLQLFKKYNISQDIVNHILEILPNYYNLDLSKYKNIKVEN